MVFGLSRASTLRKEARDVQGTPQYVHVVGAQTSGAVLHYDIADEQPVQAKYLPLNQLVIKNASGQNFILYANQNLSQPYYCDDGVITTINDVAIRSYTLKNNDAGTSTASRLIIEGSRVGMTSDHLSKKFVKSFIGRLFFAGS